MTRARGDALQLVGINTRTGAATAIGVPRDSWVSIPGHGLEKINAALYFAVTRGMAGAMRNLIGIEPDYVMVSRFPFFEDMVDDIGGTRNASTWYDRTNYYEIVPAEYLERMLWTHAERMARPVVDLPHPDGPMSARISPSGIARSRSLTAGVSP